MTLKREKSALILIDIQERVAPQMADPKQVIDAGRRLVYAARRLGIPFVVSEHMPDVNGVTIFDVREAAGDYQPIARSVFSCWREPAFKESIEKMGVSQFLLCGARMDIGVLQTALDLKEAGFKPYVAVDACQTTVAFDKEIAFARLLQANVPPVTVESALYEWVETAESEHFDFLSSLFR